MEQSSITGFSEILLNSNDYPLWGSSSEITPVSLERPKSRRSKIKYPKVKDTEFNSQIKKIYKRYKIEKNRKRMKEICFPKRFQLQIPQKFVADFINPNTPYKGLLVFHQIGAGKTCAAVNIAEQWKRKRKILVITPASLISNFYKELRTKCPGDEYISSADRIRLDNLDPVSREYKNIIDASNKKIEKYYQIISYHKYIDLVERRKINLKNKLLIIDEVQNIVSERGIFYRTLLNSINKAPNDLRVVLLSATPMFDKPVEIALTLNLLRLPTPLPTGSKFNEMFLKCSRGKDGQIKYKAINIRKFKSMIRGHISYYRGAPKVAFPGTEIKYVRCRMSDFQYKSYRTVFTKEGPFRTGDIFKLPNNFFIGSRIISNIAFPNKGINQEGYASLRGKHLMMANLRTYSVKFYKILKSIKRAEGTVFVYSNFKEYGGIKTFIKILKYHGFKDYRTHGVGKKRFAVWTGGMPHDVKERLKVAFNRKSNSDGSQIKVLLGSPSIREGVSLKRVQEVHVVEPYWNMSRLLQVIGRAVRFCSHKDMPRDKRFVDIYIYIAVHPKDKSTIDKRILSMAFNKDKVIRQFEKALKEAAVDCMLNKEANVYRGEDKLYCLR